jgi:uncharacterized protein YegL
MRPVPLLAAALVVLAPLTAHAHLDVVFLLDTTGSMSGEIREAKERVKQISEALREARADERVRLGVVAFRDKGDAYVTKVSPLTKDVERTFAFLAELRAGGGGDGPEDLLSGIAATTREMNWDMSADTERQAFLIGDAPPHLDYANHFTEEELVREALDKRIVINGVGCRSLGGRGKDFFQRIAYATEGTYQHIGKVRVGGSPDDEGLAGAMLRTLTAATDDDDMGKPVSARLVASDEATGETVHASLRTEADGGCRLDVSLPAGLSLDGAPSVGERGDGLAVGLSLRRGDGGLSRYALARCPAADTPIHLVLGE